jgi:serine/threonine protein kinase
VLPEEFARDTDRVARFQREAKLLASLNHPNIAAIYGLEESDGTHFLVMELIEGETLKDRIKSAPIPVEEALKLALQIAEGLEAAHENGVIHRDLKPANIKVTPDGKVKILDFGLAKAYAGDQENFSPLDSPTISAAATQQGVILGTAAYMSPEQARGKPVDRRADIWAFGVVLYEMLTGKSAFQGEDVSVTLASVITSDANLTLLPPDIHPRVREVVNRCLQRDMRKRYSGIGDARYEIEQALSDPSGVFVQPMTITKPRKKMRVGFPWVATVAILCLLIGASIVWYLKPTEPRRVVRLTTELPEGQQFNYIESLGLGNSVLAVSPDGNRLVYSTAEGLYLRSMDNLNARFIPGTDENPQQPFFSPDGKWIGYYSAPDQELKKISISGGAPVALCNTENFTGAKWYSNKTIVYGGSLNEIMRVPENGGTPELLIKAVDIGYGVLPQILPDGKSVLFTIITGKEDRIVVQSLESGEQKELFSGRSAQYLSTGHIVYGLGDSLFAVSFDLKRLEVSGSPILIAEGIAGSLRSDLPQYAVSDSGTLAYITGTMGSTKVNQRVLVWVDGEGKEEPLPAPADAYFGPRISPDGTKLVVTIDSGRNSDIHIWDMIRENFMQLTFNEADEDDPLWTPDGKRILFESYRDEGHSGIYWKAADGTGKAEKLITIPDTLIFPYSWSSDGRILAIVEIIEAGTGRNAVIGLVSLDGEINRKSLLHERYNESQPQISPDGRWIAYISYETGQPEIYVRPFPEVDKGKWKISTNGGNSPLWSADGRELYYRCGNAVMMVEVEIKPSFEHSAPKVLFQGNYASYFMYEAHPWDISADGKRFLMMKESTGATSTGKTPRPRINIVLNWDEELKKRVPVD